MGCSALLSNHLSLSRDKCLFYFKCSPRCAFELPGIKLDQVFASQAFAGQAFAGQYIFLTWQARDFNLHLFRVVLLT